MNHVWNCEFHVLSAAIPADVTICHTDCHSKCATFSFSAVVQIRCVTGMQDTNQINPHEQLNHSTHCDIHITKNKHAHQSLDGRWSGLLFISIRSLFWLQKLVHKVRAAVYGLGQQHMFSFCNDQVLHSEIIKFITAQSRVNNEKRAYERNKKKYESVREAHPAN